MSLTSFKRRWIEKWCDDVYQYLREGSMCNNVIGNPADETGAMTFRSILKTTVPLKSENAKNEQNILEPSKNVVARTDNEAQDTPLPLVKFSYSHFEDQRKKVERLVHGLPSLSSSTTQLDKGSKIEETSMPFIVVQREEPLKLKREKVECFERGKVTSAPASLTAQRLAQELRRPSNDVSSPQIRVNIMSTDHLNRMKATPSFNKSNVSKARKLLAKRNPASRRFDTQPYSPIENCWTMTEVTWS